MSGRPAPEHRPGAASGPCVLVTRPRPQAGPWVAALQAAGLDARALPLIEIAPLADDAPLRAAWSQLAGCAFVMFVSANAVDAFFAARPPALAWPAATLAGATGPGTTAALRRAGVPEAALRAPAPDAPSFDAEALWAELGREPHARWHGARVQVVRGEEGRDWLADRFREHGAEVAYVAAYRRVAPSWSADEAACCDAALAQPQRHCWLLSSSEAVGHLRALRPDADWGPSRAVATHPRIAAAARAAGFGTVLVAAPVTAAVADAVRALPPVAAPGAPAA